MYHLFCVRKSFHSLHCCNKIANRILINNFLQGLLLRHQLKWMPNWMREDNLFNSYVLIAFQEEQKLLKNLDNKILILNFLRYLILFLFLHTWNQIIRNLQDPKIPQKSHKLENINLSCSSKHERRWCLLMLKYGLAFRCIFNSLRNSFKFRAPRKVQ